MKKILKHQRPCANCTTPNICRDHGAWDDCELRDGFDTSKPKKDEQQEQSDQRDKKTPGTDKTS